MERTGGAFGRSLADRLKPEVDGMFPMGCLESYRLIRSASVTSVSDILANL